MKTKRNYTFVLTSLNQNEEIKNNEVTGTRIFKSECHYYAEKNIIESLKLSEKNNLFKDYVGNKYLIYKENKAIIEKTVREEDGKKITEEKEIKGSAQLIEIIIVTEDGVIIQ